MDSVDSAEKFAQLQSQLHDTKVISSDKYVTLTEDNFGIYFNETREPELVRRFTWSNHNKIQVQVITFGATITSIKLPDRAGNVEEVVLGFDDLGGYIFYEKYHFGGIVGRTTNTIMGGTFVVNGKQYWVTKNKGVHHKYGGSRGFHNVNWTPTVNGNQVCLCYLSKDGEEGYPGDLYVRVCYELTTGCEFKINISANTTKSTPVDITHFTYFNLCGHEYGEAELRRHEILVNANCYTTMNTSNEFATGEIMNVVHTRFNFQTPKILDKAMGLGADCGFDQNLCVNRGSNQDMAFVARAIHVYKGRVLEVYSNQHGVNFYTCGDFPHGRIDVPVEFLPLTENLSDSFLKDNENVFITVKKIGEYLKEVLELSPEDYHGFLKNLLAKLLKPQPDDFLLEEDSSEVELEIIGSFHVPKSNFLDFDIMMLLKPLEHQFFQAVRRIIPYVTEDMDFNTVKEIIDEVMTEGAEFSGTSKKFEGDLAYLNDIFDKHLGKCSSDSLSGSQKRRSKLSAIKEECGRVKMDKYKNVISDIYKSDRIVGRGGTVYKSLSGFSFRTQPYPTALTHSEFPPIILHPQQNYKHDITYKFCILAGNPTKWLKRMKIDASCIDTWKNI